MASRRTKEEQELADMGIPDPDKREEFFYGTGGVREDSERSAFVKVIRINDKDTYFIKYGRGDLFDPYGIDREKTNRPYYKFKKVSTAIFKHYMTYLETEKRIYLTRAKRLLMEV
jgi:hypothetical protein